MIKVQNKYFSLFVSMYYKTDTTRLAVYDSIQNENDKQTLKNRWEPAVSIVYKPNTRAGVLVQNYSQWRDEYGT